MVAARKIAEVMGGRRVLRREIDTLSDLDALIDAGIPREALEALLTQLAPVEERRQWRHRIVPRATYQRQPTLNREHGQRTERLARIFALAREVWRDDALARRFLSTPHPELQGRTPLEAALTELGARQVEEVIERGLHGLPV